MTTQHDERAELIRTLDEIIRLTVNICRTSEPTTTDHFELVNKRNQMVRDMKRRLTLPKRDWLEKLGFELRQHGDVWLLIEDGGAEREATLNERVLWDALQDAAMLSASPAAPAAAQVAQPLTCEWSLTDDDAGVYSSACGEMWVFNDGGPKENSVRFCQGCGKPVQCHGIGKDQS